MRLFFLVTFFAALLSAYYIIQLPYLISICLFAALVILAYYGYARKSSLASRSAFFGFLALSAIMGGYRADVQGMAGTILPEFIVGGIGIILILFEELKPSARR